MYSPGFQFFNSNFSGVNYQTEATMNISVIGRMINAAISYLTQSNIPGVNGVVGTYDYNKIGDACMKIYNGAMEADSGYQMPLTRDMFVKLFNYLTSNSVTLFSDQITTGTAWTVQSGSFTFSGSGATSGATAAYMTAGNAAWKPSPNIPLVAQATFTEPTTPGGFFMQFFMDTNNYYVVDVYSGNLHIEKKVGGNNTTLTSVAFTPSASTSYTLTFTLDALGNLTAKLYNGVGTGGSLLQTLTANDTSLPGGFLVGVGCDTGVVISGDVVTGAFPISLVPF